MMTKMPEPVVAHPRPFAKLPTVHGIVNQKIRYVPDNQAACGSAGNLDIPKEREKRAPSRTSKMSCRANLRATTSRKA